MQGRSRSMQELLRTSGFAKLGAIYARLNLYNKPMQVFNVDECGVNVTARRESGYGSKKKGCSSCCGC